MNMKEYLVDSPEEMVIFGQEMAKQYKVILLSGELGAGKTLFTKGFAQGLGINPDKVQSPTYTYINIYDEKLLHMDLYRLDSLDDMTKKGIFDQIAQYDYICIEWPKFVDYLDLDNPLSLLIEKTETGRKISIE